MNRRVGAESLFGIGAGLCSEESRKNLEIAEGLCRRGRPEESIPYLEIAMKDDRNLDAWIQLAHLAPNMDTTLEILEAAKKIGEKSLRRVLGTKCFYDSGDHVGRFWGLLETRPYMRVLQNLAKYYFTEGHFRRAAETSMEMLRLNPGDNQGQRDSTGTFLLKAKRTADALSFVQHWLEPEVRKTGLPPPRGGCVFETPSKQPLSAEILASWEGDTVTHAGFVYTAAFASFKLWGDCQLARQYLVIAARLNPHVLLKILAKVDQPKGPNNSPRQFNGPEEAHDYLWHSQDLWMVEDVWNWANSREDALKYTLKPCSKEGCPNKETSVAEFKRCGSCHGVWYCGQECQKADWKTHKPKCQDHKRMKATIKAMGQGRPTPKDGKQIVGATADFSEKGITTKFHG